MRQYLSELYEDWCMLTPQEQFSTWLVIMVGTFMVLAAIGIVAAVLGAL